MTDRLRRDGAHDVLILAEAELDRCRWAVYQVRRCYTAPARAWRSVDTVARGSRAETGDILGRIAAQLRVPFALDAAIPGLPGFRPPRRSIRIAANSPTSRARSVI
ncbi:hypothetical protein, partial [Nocardia gipuzkoensis]